MAKFYKKKVVLDKLSIELEEYDLSYFFIKTNNIPEYDEIRSSLEEHFGKNNFVYHCCDESEKEMILDVLEYLEIM